MKKNSIVLLGLVNFLISHGQILETSEINIRIENSTYYKQFFVNIKRDSNRVYLEYKIRQAANNSEREKDSNIIRLRENLKKVTNKSPTNDSFIKLLDSLDSIYLAYTTFRIDTLIISRKSFGKYDILMDRLFITQTDSLQNSGHTYLDGTSFVFRMIYKGQKRKVYANSINTNNHPQLAEFMAATMCLVLK